MSTSTTDIVGVVLWVTGVLLLPLGSLSDVLLSLSETKAVCGASVCCNGMGSSLGVLNPSADVAVLDGISSSVVVDVISDTNLSSEQSSLLSGLELLSSGEQSTDWDTGISKSLVIGSGSEGGWDVSELSIVGEVILEELLNWSGSWWAGKVEGASVSIVDGVDKVGGGNHVEVEVDGDLGKLLWGQAFDIGGGTEKSDFLSRPESEADGVLDGECGQLLSNLEETDDSRSIIVDTGTWAS